MVKDCVDHSLTSPPPPSESMIKGRNDADNEAPVPYSSYTSLQKSLIAFAASVSAMFSGLSSFIYYPAITPLARSLHTSVEAINLSITAYLITSGLAPSIFGDMADQVGRRPISLLALTLYFAANLGLALQHDYVALVVLRCMQSAGASSTIALAYGILADISTPAERGHYMAVLMGFTNAAPCLGPVIGGILTEKLSWHWIFWLLIILSGLHLLGLSMFLPETCRKLVGDGSVTPARLINRSVYGLFSCQQNSDQRPVASLTPLSFPNPLSCLKTLFQKGTFIVLVVGGIQYTMFGCLAASLSTQTIRLYSLSYLTAGLVYLPSGIGGIMAAYLTGKLIDRDFRIVARCHGFSASKSSQSPQNFPFEKARLRSVFPLLVLSTIATTGYGWALQTKAHIAVPLVMQFVTGSSQVSIFVICGSLITDLNPGRVATAQASYNLVRCALGGAGIGLLQAVIDGVRVGWCFTIYAVLGSLSVPLFMFLRSRV